MYRKTSRLIFRQKQRLVDLFSGGITFGKNVAYIFKFKWTKYNKERLYDKYNVSMINITFL